MPPDPEVQAVTPRNMRPRGTPNAEMSAQKRDAYLNEVGKGYGAPEVKDVPLRGYAKGGAVKNFCKGGKVISSRNM